MTSALGRGNGGMVGSTVHPATTPAHLAKAVNSNNSGARVEVLERTGTVSIRDTKYLRTGGVPVSAPMIAVTKTTVGVFHCSPRSATVIALRRALGLWRPPTAVCNTDSLSAT